VVQIYHIVARDAWDAAQEAGEYRADSLGTQGFIHFSEADQVARVANAIYSGQDDLLLLEVDSERLRAALKYEPPDTTVPAAHDSVELFPHLYGPLNLDAVARVTAFAPDEDGVFHFLGE
jgi:uncharacterized protein (DUF952 family)